MKRATGPAARIDNHGNIRRSETDSHDFISRPREQPELLTNKSELTDAQKLAALFGIVLETQEQRFARLQREYGDNLIKIGLDSYGDWRYAFEVGIWAGKTREYRRPCDKHETTWELFERILKSRLEFRDATPEFRQDYYNWLRANALTATKRRERPWNGDPQTMRIKSKGGDPSALVVGKV